MLNALSAPTAPTVMSPPTALKSGNADATAEHGDDDFAQALDDASAQQPKAPGRDKLRGPARLPPVAETAKPAPQALPALAETQDMQTLPPESETEATDADGPLTPQGVAALLAELRAAVPPAQPAAAGAAAADAATKLSLPPAADAADPKRAGGVLSTHGEVAADVRDKAAMAGLTAAAIGAARADDGSSPHDGSRDSQRDSSATRFAEQLAAALPADSAAARIDSVPLPQAIAAAPVAAPPVRAEAQLPATPGSAEFAPQLGAQISTFVRDGIEHARLHLNPAEMGPVSVQIQLEGQTAMVHLSAENAQTRQALEQALPQLAGSLREAGLTLSGGGVFEQPRQSRDGQPGADEGRGQRAGARVEGRVDAALAVPEQARRRGVVDLVA